MCPLLFSNLNGKVVDMSWTCRDVGHMLQNFCQHLSNVMTPIFQSFLNVGHTSQWPEEKMAPFIFYCIFEFFGMKAVHCMKKEKACL